MSVFVGFDMVPRLSSGVVDGKNWQSLIDSMKKHYKDDDLVEVKSNYIMFKVGQQPLLPFEGHKFLRFSSTISEEEPKVKEYIDTVYRVAKVYFGSRIREWKDSTTEGGSYSQQEVHDSIDSYEQPDELELSTSTDSMSELNVPLFEVQPVPTKGKGLLARFDIVKGERIVSEEPLMISPKVTPISRMEEIIIAKLKLLSQIDQRKYLSLHNNFPGKHPFSGIMRTNALPCGPGAGAVYPTICFINHSCVPNAHHSWNSDLECETIHAASFIKAGEEITISYYQGGSAQSRQSYLKNAFGFNCKCNLCSISPAEIQESDHRRDQMELLDASIGNPVRVMSSPDWCLQDCHSLLQILEKEFNGNAVALIARLYYDAFQISIIHGDQARAYVFAERGYRSRVICEGEDSPESKRMKFLMGDPTGYEGYGISNKWGTLKNMLPKGLGGDEFEKWLWRREK